MRANYRNKRPITVTSEDYARAVNAEVTKRCHEQDFYIAAQFLAIVLINLELCYGWKGVRLAKFVNSLNSTAELACNTNIMGKSFNSAECIRHLKEKYGIDCLAITKGM